MLLMKTNSEFLRRAIDLAYEGMLKGGGPFGALVVCEGKVVAEAYNRVVISHDPTAHAEINAIREATSKLGTHTLDGCILYTSCEPCPMCLGAIYWAGIREVVYAFDRKDAEGAGFSDRLIYDELKLEPGARKIRFLRITDHGGKEVFTEWNNLENKTPY